MLQVPKAVGPPTPPGPKGSNGTWCLTSLRQAWSTVAGGYADHSAAPRVTFFGGVPAQPMQWWR